jgi:hypothetical protein
VRPRARRAPAAEAAPAVVASEAPVDARPPPGTEIRYEQLRDLLGRRFRFNTAQMLGSVATVENYTESAVTLRVHVSGGFATYKVSRENLRRIIVM